MKIGIDIEEIERFKLKKSDPFNRRVFTDVEIEYAYKSNNPEIHLCGFFCAKEALKKTIEQKGLEYRDIEISHQESGKPWIKFKDGKFESEEFELSISHCKIYGIATVIRIKNG